MLLARLGVNIDHVATLRQARGGREPDPVAAAVLAELAGADGIVVHLREDRRHIQDRDVRLLREVLTTRLDLELAVTDQMIKIALSIRPEMVTLVPERRQELTTEGGLDVPAHREEIQQAINLLHDGGILVSLFIDPDPAQIKISHKVSADFVELHTGKYANERTEKGSRQALESLQEGARLASKLGLKVNAGHGLTYGNVSAVTDIREIEEFNIGHSIISRGAMVGLDMAVREMKTLVR
jgi:pyridoxine 5-phosphate synthase